MFHHHFSLTAWVVSLVALVATGCLASAPGAGTGTAISTPSGTPGATYGPQQPPATGTSAATPSGRPVPPKAGNVAWDFTLSTLQGEQIRLSDLRGKKVMLNFWATWCGPCRIEIPHMVKLYEEMRGQDFEILAVNLREDSKKVQPFVESLKMNFPVLLDPSGKVAQAYYIRGIPTSIFIDEEGIIQTVHVGTLSDQLLREYVKRLME